MPAAKTLREIDHLLAEYVELENRHISSGAPELEYKNVSALRNPYPTHRGIVAIGELLHRCKSSSEGATRTLVDLARIVNHYCDDLKDKRTSTLEYLNAAVDLYMEGMDVSKAIKRSRAKVESVYRNKCHAEQPATSTAL